MTNVEKLLLVYQSDISMLAPRMVKETTALRSQTAEIISLSQAIDKGLKAQSS
jgi:hypothetical protein